jgi:hypothetical protein
MRERMSTMRERKRKGGHNKGEKEGTTRERKRGHDEGEEEGIPFQNEIISGGLQGSDKVEYIDREISGQFVCLCCDYKRSDRSLIFCLGSNRKKKCGKCHLLH